MFMGTIQPIGKWNNETNTWHKPSSNQIGRAFSLCDYEYILNDPKKGINYIIVCDGKRLNLHTFDTENIGNYASNMKHIINHYKKSNGNYVIKLFMIDNDAPIIEDAKMLANYVDLLTDKPTTNSVNLVCLSKCGAMSVYIPRFFKNIDSYNKTNIYSIAAPYKGTKLASPKLLYPDLHKIVSTRLGNGLISDLVYKGMIDLYEYLCSNSHMDYDIAVPGEVPQERIYLYDRSFIRDIFDKKNMDALNRINSFTNITTGIDANTLPEAIRTINVTGMCLCLLDELLFDKPSDGMVRVKDQKAIESVLGIDSINLESSHHDVFSNNRAYSKVLDIVDDTIEDFNQKKLFLNNQKRHVSYK